MLLYWSSPFFTNLRRSPDKPARSAKSPRQNYTNRYFWVAPWTSIELRSKSIRNLTPWRDFPKSSRSDHVTWWEAVRHLRFQCACQKIRMLGSCYSRFCWTHSLIDDEWISLIEKLSNISGTKFIISEYRNEGSEPFEICPINIVALLSTWIGPQHLSSR